MFKKNTHTFSDGRTGSALTVKVTPRAARNEITGVMRDGTIKMYVRTASAEREANAAVIGVLREKLGIAKKRIEIVAGENNDQKLVAIEGLSPREVEARLGIESK